MTPVKSFISPYPALGYWSDSIIFFMIKKQLRLVDKEHFQLQVFVTFYSEERRFERKKENKLVNQRTNGPVNAHLRPEIYTRTNKRVRLEWYNASI